MPTVIVVSAGKDKYKVLIDYVQRGIVYHSESLANHQADKLRQQFEARYQNHR